MLKRIELWDFEAHEHTVVEDLSAGLNLVVGESNAGKTSIVRALKLVAYNEFDPRSIRVGATKCKVLVETERGTVKVTRGPKNNLWEITPVGKKTQFLDKVGKDVVPQAAEILGLNVVTLGDVEVPVNIMDQLESHFMLAGVGGKDASGSMRAQIVDEISGLSGIEGLIKSVSLDVHRFGREVKDTEDKMEETRKQLHDESALADEEVVLGGAEANLSEHDECVAAAEAGDVLSSEMARMKSEAEDNSRILADMPDLDAVKATMDEAEQTLAEADVADKLAAEAKDAYRLGDELEERLSGMPDVASVAVFLKEAGEILDVLRDLTALVSDLDALEGQRKALEGRLEGLKGLEGVEMGLEEAEASLVKIGAATAVLREVEFAGASLGSKERELEDVQARLVAAVKERDDVLSQVKVCPLTLNPVRPECVNEAKGER